MRHIRYFRRIVALLLVLTMLVGPMAEIGYAADVTITDGDVLESEIVDNEIEDEDSTVSSNGDTVKPVIDTNTSELPNNGTTGNNTVSSEEEGLIGEIITTDTGFRIQMNADEQSYSVLEYVGASSDVVVPSSYEGLPVTKILDAAFYGNTKVKTITIPDSIVFVGEYTFYGCTALKYNVADGGNYLGNEANPYYYFVAPVINEETTADSITEFTVHADTVLVGSYAFAGLKNLKKVVMGDNLIHIGYAAMGKDSNVESLTIPFIGADGKGARNYHLGYIFGARTTAGNISYVPLTLKELVVTGGNGGTKIVRNCLYGIDMVESLTLPFLGGYLGDEENGYLSYVFGGESYNNNNVVPKKVKRVIIIGGRIFDYAFRECIYVEEILLKDGVTSIGMYAFRNCSNLTSVSIGKGITSIGSNAFSGSNGLISISIPESVTSIGSSAFQGCSSLTSVSIPESVTSIGMSAFQGCSSLTNISIPDGVISIGGSAFERCSSLTSVSISESVTSIGSFAFSDCNGLTSVHITSIESWCSISFNNFESNPLCYAENLYLNGEKVSELVIPEGVTSIGEYAFSGCCGITSISIPNSVTSMSSAFKNCTSLTSVNIGEGVTSIDNSAFYGCSSLTSVSIPEGVTNIGDFAFYHCDNITSVSIPDSVTSIGSSAFRDCNGLTSVHITSIESWCSISFNGFESNPLCYAENLYLNGEKVVELVIPEGVTSIGDWAFYRCKSLTSISIPDSVTYIDSYVFSYCDNLASINFGEKIPNIDRYAFYGCSGLTGVYITSIRSWCSSSFVYSESNPLYYAKNLYLNGEKVSELVIPEGVTSIGDWAFYRCKSLTSVSIPDSVTNIGGGAFEDCDGLTSVYITSVETWCSINFGSNPLNYAENLYINGEKVSELVIPEGVTSISEWAFWGFNGITSVSIPDSVTSIGDCAFYNCINLTDISIGKGITLISYNAFSDCNALTSAVYNGSETEWKKIDIKSGNNNLKNVISFADRSLAQTIMNRDVTSYSLSTRISDVDLTNSTETTENWSEGLEFVSLGDGTCLVSGIGECTDTEVYIPDVSPDGDRVVGIDGCAFYGCKNITSVSIPDGVTSIGGSAFYDCRSLTSVNIPDGVTSISSNTFERCSSLASINIPDSVETIEWASFARSGLASISLGNGITFIESEAFFNCPSLASVYITSIESWCSIEFVDMSSNPMVNAEDLYLNGEKVIELVIPEGVTNIGDFAFYHCDNITSVSIAESVTSIGDYAFAWSNSLTSVSISENVTSIGDYAFWKCNSLTNISIPESVTSIGRYAFYNDDSSMSVHIPNMTTWCKINFKNAVENPLYYDAQVYIGDVCLSESSCISIPHGITYIGTYQFCYHENLIELEIPNSVEEIWSYALAYCENLSTINYMGEENEWRHVRKVTDMDVDAGDYVVNTKPASGYLFEADETMENFWVSGYVGVDTQLVIPEIYSNRPVNTIYDKTFDNKEFITSIQIPDSVDYIGRYAFRDCQNLKEINLPADLKNIGFGIFESCNSLDTIELPFLGYTIEEGTDEYLGYYFGAPSYKDNGTYVPQSLKNVTVLNAEKIADYCFYGCNYIEEVEFPLTITSIGDYAFGGCNALTAMNIADTVTGIGKGAFSDCSSITEIVIPKVTTIIGDSAFEGCTILATFEFADESELKEIGDYAFEDCISLISFEISDSVIDIGEKIFTNCNSIQKITIGKSLTIIPEYQTGDPLFGLNKSKSSLKQYVVSTDNTSFATDANGILYRKLTIDSEDKLVAVMDAPAMANLRGYTIPDLIVEIAPYAFAYNNSLTAVDLGYVRMIGNNAFFEADSLIYVALNPVPAEDADEALLEALKNVEYNQYIGSEAFMGCDNLMRIDIDSDNIIGIDDYAFVDCPKLTKINLGDKVQKLGLSAFGATASGDSNIEWISVDGTNTYFKSINGVLYSVNEDGSLILELYPARLITYDNRGNKSYRTEFALPTGQNISAIQSYAFQGAKDLNELVVDTDSQLIVGDYAFAGSQIQMIEIGENVTSLGLLRGESEYTVFSDMEYLTDITVDENNAYYSSKSGVLFDKNQRKLIKYPAAKTGSEYTVPDTVANIASMAFKGNSNLDYVTITSDVSTIGLEAFYACSSLDQISFKDAYAPMSIMENAFTTKLEIEGEVVEDPRTLIGYFEDYYADGENGEYGWNHYDGVYSLVACKSVPELEVTEDSSNFYAVIVIDSNGTKLGNVQITLTDPNGVSETVMSGSTNGSTGMAMFYDLYDKVGMGFDIDFERPYTMTVSDPYGDYYTYTNPSFYLDENTLVTYITMTTMPTVYGVNCNGEDVNSQRVELNKAQIEFTELLLDANGSIQYGTDGTTPLFKEIVEISAIGYCDTESGYAFVDANGNVLDASCGLYQNGIKVADVARTEVVDGATVFYFEPKVTDLANEVDIEVRLVAVHDTQASLSCNTVLNIHVFDFSISKEDINLETEEFDIDVSQAGEIFKTLFGDDGLEVSVGKNTKLSMEMEKDLITILLKYNKKGSASYSDHEEGYKQNAKNGKEYLFSYDYLFIDEEGEKHILNYNIRFARATEDEDYYYYRCMLYDGRIGTDKNRLVTFYGVVNKPNLPFSVSDRLDAKNKADLIFAMHYAYVLSECKTISDVKKSGEQAYYESIPKKPQTSSEQNFSFGLSGEIQIKYEGNGKFTPVESTIKGEVAYTFKYNQQMVVWIIPVTLSVEVNAEGKIELKLDFDEDRKIQIEELEATLKLDVNASVGAGCSMASVGIYGNVGTVFVLDILPEFEVESWKIYGELGAYIKVLWKEKKIRITPDSWKDGYYIIQREDDDVEETSVMMLTEQNYLAAMYLTELYENVTPETLAKDYRLVVIDGELYKLCYADVAGLDNYDEYNYVKLALSKWNGTEWTTPVIIDDNGFNDAAYALYQDGDKTMLIFTQQTEKATAESLEDTYVSAQNLAIKVVELSAEMSTPETVFARENYAYLTQYTMVNGIPTIVWAENADNNMFGVSPYNYIDSNGVSHVFATTANSVWVTQYVDGAWSEAECLVDGLSTVTQLVVNESGYVAYVVDTNGDLSDTDDRVMNYGKLQGDMESLNDVANGSIISVLPDDAGFIYYYDVVSDNEAETDGWYTVATKVGSIIQNLPSYVPTDFVPVYDDNGDITVILYKWNKSWTEDGENVTGSAIYGIFYEDGTWGEPVEISSFIPEENRYILHFSAVMLENGLAISVSTSDENGESVQNLDCEYVCEAALRVKDHTINYTEGTVTFVLENIGSAATFVYMSLDNGSYELLPVEKIHSGESIEYVLALSGDASAVHSVIFATSSDGNNAVSVDNISMSYSDLRPVVKQLLMGENDVMLLAIKNTGNLTNTGITIVRVGSRVADAIVSEEVLAAISGLELVEGEVQLIEFTNENGEKESAWVVKDTVEAGKIIYHELVLDEHPNVENGVLLGAYTVAINDTEYGTAADNNYTYLYYEACVGVLAEDESVDTTPSIADSVVSYDPESEEDVIVDVAYGTEDSISDIQIDGQSISTDNYSVESRVVGGRVTLSKAYADTLRAGVHVMSVVFASGVTCELQLKVTGYYTITWKDGKETLGTTTVPEGTLPSYGKKLTKASDAMYDYYFAGWDCDGDGEVDAISIANSDVTYTAVWRVQARKYTVTWEMEDAEGNQYQIEETYEYGAAPEYKGTVFVPDGKQFDGWNQAVSEVTGDVTYTANYSYTVGDINGDNKRDIKDVIMLRQYILGLRELTEEQIEECNVYEDYNSDGSAKINAKDIALLKQYVLGVAS